MYVKDNVSNYPGSNVNGDIKDFTANYLKNFISKTWILKLQRHERFNERLDNLKGLTLNNFHFKFTLKTLI